MVKTLLQDSKQYILSRPYSLNELFTGMVNNVTELMVIWHLDRKSAVLTAQKLNWSMYNDSITILQRVTFFMMNVSESPIACLLIHGLNGSPYDFHELELLLSRNNYVVENMLLPGHDIHHFEAIRFGWKDWYGAVQRHFEKLSLRHKQIVLIGHSMGGSLALKLAAQIPTIAGIVSLCAPTELHQSLYPIVRFGRYILPYFPILREDIRDSAERQHYRKHKITQWAAMAPLHTLLLALPELRADLPKIHCPALIIGARNDHVVPLRDAHYIYSHISSPDKDLIILNQSWHVVTRDVEQGVVESQVKAFLSHIQHHDWENEDSSSA